MARSRESDSNHASTPHRLETLAGLLERRGLSAARIEKLLGGNFARLLRDVWG